MRAFYPQPSSWILKFACTDCIRKPSILLVTRSRLYKQDYLVMPTKGIKQDLQNISHLKLLANCHVPHNEEVKVPTRILWFRRLSSISTSSMITENHEKSSCVEKKKRIMFTSSNPRCPTLIHVAKIIYTSCLFEKIIHLFCNTHFPEEKYKQTWSFTFNTRHFTKIFMGRIYLLSATSRPSNFISTLLKIDNAYVFLPRRTKPYIYYMKCNHS